MWAKEQIAYCSNVHAGEAAVQVQENLTRYTTAIRERRKLTEMQHGLWLSEISASEYAASPQKLESLQQQLQATGLSVATLNGFPLGNFHAGRVKETVYQPHWGETRRLNYTTGIAALLAKLLPADQHFGTISTLPMGYARGWTEQQQQSALEHLAQAASALKQLEASDGKQIQLCLEMEPGCVLEETADVIQLFQQQLPPVMQTAGLSEDDMYRYLGLCFDICHQAVMFEDIGQSLQQIHAAGIHIGKIQISSALKIRQPHRSDVKTWLSDYAESRYLHQVTGLDTNKHRLFSDDLELILDDPAFNDLNEWRIHFHVPVHQSTLAHDWAGTTADEIDRVFDFLVRHPNCRPQLELETYTWEVLPESLRPKSDEALITGLQSELTFIESRLLQHGLLQGQEDD